MVTRKSSIPLPKSSPPPPPELPTPLQPHNNLDSSDLPPIPASAHRAQDDSPYGDMGNPWAESPTSQQPQHTTEIPGPLRPGAGRSNFTTNPVSSDVPDILKPGWSGINTPRSSTDSDRSRDFWESSDEEDDDQKKAKAKNKGKGKAKENVGESGTNDPDTEDLIIPSQLQIKRKPVGESPLQTSEQQTHDRNTSNIQLSSNNPFRRTSAAANPGPLVDGPNQATEEQVHEGQQADPPIEAFQKISLDTDNNRTHPHDNTPDGQQRSQYAVPPVPQAPPPPIPSTAPPPVPEPELLSPYSSQPPLIPVSPKAEDQQNPWSSQPRISATPSPIPFAPSQKQDTHSTDDLLDRGPKADGRIFLGDELRVLPNAVQTSTSQASLLDVDEDVAPPKPPRPNPAFTDEHYDPPPGPPPSYRAGPSAGSTSPVPPTKPPRPAAVVKPLTDREISQMREQRNETYQIKHFNWFDHRTNKLRTSSMLTQNENGPCPLLALVNALILGAKEASQAALDDALRSREQVTLGLIIETLMDEMLTSGAHLDGQLPDVDELNRFLMKLRTGMNMNPRFVQAPSQPPNLMDARNSMLHMPTSQSQNLAGSFEATPDIKLYSVFGVPTFHGWLPEPGSKAVGAFSRSAQNYEDAQVVQFGEEELEYKLSNGGLTPQEQQLWQDIISIKGFFRSHPTQLTPFGLHCIKQTMASGAFAILFRNDHFSTIYKHPRDGNLYTLISDAGYADRDEIIWETLVDISGQESEFFSGDFQSVSHNSSQSDTSRRRSAHLSTNAAVDEPLSPQQQQEQHDADFAMALQLQEEEDQRLRQERSNQSGTSEAGRGRGGGGAGARGGRGGRGGGDHADSGPTRRGQGIPIPLRSNSNLPENRPHIPPRNTRANMPAVNRPSDTLNPDAPPSYEEAAKGEPYNPPMGSPLHPSSSPIPSPYNSSSNIHLPDSLSDSPSTDRFPTQSSFQNRRPEQRQSAYAQNYERYGHGSRQSLGSVINDDSGRMPGTYIYTGAGGHGRRTSSGGGLGGAGPSGSNSTGGRPAKSNDGDCVLM